VNLPIKTENKFQTKIYYLQTENLQIIKEFKKIVLTLPFNQFLYYSTEKFKDEFNEIERATSIDINKLNLDFKITTEINTYDEDYLKFQKNMIKLQYILYSLKISLEKIKQQNIDNLNPHFQFLSQRISITKENLERNILYYEKIYKNFVENIKLI
jgi:hypothetical protein